MGSGAEFRVLGPLEVEVDGRGLDLGGPRLRAVLALLVAAAGRVVSLPTLVDGLWGLHPPDDADRTVQAYVSRLRRALAPAAASVGTAELIVTRRPGYLLRLDPDAVDAARFARLAADGRRSLSAGQPALAAERLAAALELWQGDAYVEFDGIPVLRAEAARLDRARLAALQDRIEADLTAGAGIGLVAELEGLVAEHPGHERLWGQLMTALYRAGRQADALAAFQQARAALATESGLEPSPGLLEIHREVLAQDPRLLHPPAEDGRGRPTVRPAQLPAAVSAFAGRADELAALDARLPEPDGVALSRPATVVISALSGTAGVGKTALAVHWAHRVADRFPDGQLYVNLRGYDPDQPLDPADALAGFLEVLGVPPAAIPLDLADRAARYRTEISGRRMLVVLDNAATVEQVRPLLPGTATAVVVVTSRDSLAGLVAVDGARRLSLDLLPADDAVALLRELIGPRVDAEPVAAATLADRCARLPLALRIAAEHAAAAPRAQLRDLVADLDDESGRLDRLTAGDDPRAAVGAVFSWSYRHLPADAARVFRLVGLHPGPDFDSHAVAALAETGLDDARLALDQLARAHLLRPTVAGRFGLHDLLRAYAAGLAGREDGPTGRRAALDRLLDSYLSAAAAAMDRLHPAEADRRPRLSPSRTTVPVPPDPAAARSWLDLERPNLVAVTAYAAAHERAGHAVALSATLYRYLSGGHFTDAIAIHGHARDAARRAGDLMGEAQAVTGLGAVYGQTGRPEQAIEQHQRALALFERADDLAGQARAHGNLGVGAEWRGAVDVAAVHFEQALLLFRRAGDPVGEASALSGLGDVEAKLDRYDEAADHYREALEACRPLGDRDGEAWTLIGLAELEARRHRDRLAAEWYGQALTVFEELGNRSGQAWSLTGSGTVHTRLGRPALAVDLHRRALALFEEIGDPDGPPRALTGLDDAYRALATGPASR